MVSIPEIWWVEFLTVVVVSPAGGGLGVTASSMVMVVVIVGVGEDDGVGKNGDVEGFNVVFDD